MMIVMISNKEKFTELQRILIAAFETTSRQLGFYSMILQDVSLCDDVVGVPIDYAEIGRKMIMIFIRNDVVSLLEKTQRQLQTRNYVCLLSCD